MHINQMLVSSRHELGTPEHMKNLLIPLAPCSPAFSSQVLY